MQQNHFCADAPRGENFGCLQRSPDHLREGHNRHVRACNKKTRETKAPSKRAALMNARHYRHTHGKAYFPSSETDDKARDTHAV